MRSRSSEGRLELRFAYPGTDLSDHPIEAAIYGNDIAVTIYNDSRLPGVANLSAGLRSPLGSEAPRDTHATGQKCSTVLLKPKGERKP